MTTLARNYASLREEWKLPAALFLLSFATVAFTIALFRLLTFFIMPSLFFDLLFIGFPLGALAGVRFFRVSRVSFLNTLWLLQGAMLFSVFAMFACKHFDYLRAHLFDVELQRLFVQMLTFTLFFLPFFVTFGLSEYLGYQVGRRSLRWKNAGGLRDLPVRRGGNLPVRRIQVSVARRNPPAGNHVSAGRTGNAAGTPAAHMRRILLLQQVLVIALLAAPQLEAG